MILGLLNNIASHQLLVTFYVFMLHLGAHASVNEAIKLHPCEIIDVSSLEGSADYQAVANNPELLAGLDELVHTWCKQIEQVSSSY